MSSEPVSTSVDAAAPVPLARTAYELAARGLADQKGTLDDLRSRTGTLIAAGALAASFLGGRALDDVGFDVLSSFALGSFLVSLVLAGWILWPGEAMTFSASGTRLYDEAFDQPESEIYRRLAYWLDEMREANGPALGRLAVRFQIALAAVFVAITLWAIAIATS
jgi:hypothetical protein